MENGDVDGPKENDILKDCCANVYEGFKKFGKKWYKFTLFRKLNGLDETNGDTTMGDSTINITSDDDDENLDSTINISSDDDDLDGEEEEDLEGEEDGKGLDEGEEGGSILLAGAPILGDMDENDDKEGDDD